MSVVGQICVGERRSFSFSDCFPRRQCAAEKCAKRGVRRRRGCAERVEEIRMVCWSQKWKASGVSPRSLHASAIDHGVILGEAGLTDGDAGGATRGRHFKMSVRLREAGREKGRKNDGREGI